jgi:hypothetical protein
MMSHPCQLLRQHCMSFKGSNQQSATALCRACALVLICSTTFVCMCSLLKVAVPVGSVKELHNLLKQDRLRLPCPVAIRRASVMSNKPLQAVLSDDQVVLSMSRSLLETAELKNGFEQVSDRVSGLRCVELATVMEFQCCTACS